MVPNVPEFTMAYFGILYAGCIVVPINVLLSGEEVRFHLEDSDAKLLVAHSFFRATADQGAGAAGIPIVWTEGEADDSIPAMARAEPLDAIHPTSAIETAVILYTSGTTGRPKGAELTHSNLLLNCAVVTPRLISLKSDDVALATLPFFHSFGQTCIQNATIAFGAAFTLLPRFDPAEAFELIERDRVTFFTGVPTMYFALLHHEGQDSRGLRPLRDVARGELQPDRPAPQAGQHRLPGVGRGDADPRPERPPAARRRARRDLHPRTQRHEGLSQAARGHEGGNARRLVPLGGHRRARR
jgi:long-chain acyl-CoA synthetase